MASTGLDLKRNLVSTYSHQTILPILSFRHDRESPVQNKLTLPQAYSLTPPSAVPLHHPSSMGPQSGTPRLRLQPGQVRQQEAKNLHQRG